MNTFPECLVGMQLVKWYEGCNTLVLRDANQQKYMLWFDDTHSGDCCGYNEVSAELYISDEDLSANPIITRVEKVKDGTSCMNEVELIFFGESKKLMSVSSTSGSESGYSYGACVTVHCKDLKIEEVVTKW